MLQIFDQLLHGDGLDMGIFLLLFFFLLMRLTRFERYASDAVTIHLFIFRGRAGMIRVVVDSATLHSNP